MPLDNTEQKAIATILSDMDAEIAALERRRDKTRAIKQGMMQRSSPAGFGCSVTEKAMTVASEPLESARRAAEKSDQGEET